MVVAVKLKKKKKKWKKLKRMNRPRMHVGKLDAISLSRLLCLRMPPLVSLLPSPNNNSQDNHTNLPTWLFLMTHRDNCSSAALVSRMPRNPHHHMMFLNNNNNNSNHNGISIVRHLLLHRHLYRL